MARRRLVLLVLTAVLPACSNGPDGPLFDNAWVLSSVIEQGQPVEVPGGSSIRWRFVASGGCDESVPECTNGPKLQGTDVCNDFTRGVAVEGDTVVWGAYGESTAVGCSGGAADTLDEFFRQPSFRFVVDGDEMRATSSDSSIELVFTAGG
jgi:chitodextrinase